MNRPKIYKKSSICYSSIQTKNVKKNYDHKFERPAIPLDTTEISSRQNYVDDAESNKCKNWDKKFLFIAF